MVASCERRRARSTGRCSGSPTSSASESSQSALGETGLIDDGEQAGTSTEDGQRLKELEQEVRELRRANAILRSASAFFAAELDRPQK